MKNPKISLTGLFPSLIDIVKARKEGFPCYHIQHYFSFNFGTFQSYIDYQNDNYVLKFRGFINGDYYSKWQTYISTPFQKRAIEAFTSLCIDYFDPTPF